MQLCWWPKTLVEHPKLLAAGLLMAPRAMTPHLGSLKVLDESCQHQQAPFCALPFLVQKSVPVERWDVLWLHRRVVALFITPGIQTWLAGNSSRIRCVSQSSQTSPSPVWQLELFIPWYRDTVIAFSTMGPHSSSMTPEPWESPSGSGTWSPADQEAPTFSERWLGFHPWGNPAVWKMISKCWSFTVFPDRIHRFHRENYWVLDVLDLEILEIHGGFRWSRVSMTTSRHCSFHAASRSSGCPRQSSGRVIVIVRRAVNLKEIPRSTTALSSPCISMCMHYIPYFFYIHTVT